MRRDFEDMLQRSIEEEGGTWDLYHSNLLAKSTFFSKLQTAALMITTVGSSHTHHINHWRCFDMNDIRKDI